MEWKKQLPRIGKALLVSMILTGLLLLLMALILYQANLAGLAESVMVIVIYVVACLAGGFLLGKQEEKRRFLWGAGFGALYFLLLLLLSVFLPGATQTGIMDTSMDVSVQTGLSAQSSMMSVSSVAGSVAGLSALWGERLRVFVICVLGGMAGGMLS